MTRPRIKRTLELVTSSDGDIYVLRPAEGSDLRIERPDATARALLQALDGTRTVAQLERQFGAGRVGTAIADLAAADLLDDAEDDLRVPGADWTRYDRQLRYFSDLAGDGLTASDCQARLRRATVVVLGVGGLGSWASFALACCGVGELVLLDGDSVEESNFNRQILYRERDVGRAKVEAAGETLAAFNSGCRLTTVKRRLEDVASVAEVVEGATFVVNGADWPAHDIERWVNRACFEAGVPFITMSHSPPVARVGPLYVPSVTGCFECQEATYREGYPLYDELVEQRRGRASEAATLGPVCAFVGGQVALETLHHLTGLVAPASRGVGLAYDLRTMEVTREEVPHRADCPVCGR